MTIFTPTYNRAFTLERLYNSLIMQDSSNFEWLIVDDGSSDNSTELVEKWINEQLITINYISTENGGKHRAINRGVKEAKGELFFIVDSDDYLTFDAISTIERKWSEIAFKYSYAGLCFRRINPKNGKIIGAPFVKDGISGSAITIHYLWKITQDKAEVFRTDIIKKFPFPEFENEKFVSEAIVWNKIALSTSHLLKCYNIGIYICQYQRDGLTLNFNRLVRNNPNGMIAYYSSLLKLKEARIEPITLLKIAVRLCQSYFWKIVRF